MVQHKLLNPQHKTKKTKEIIIDFRKCKNKSHNSLVIHGEEVEQVPSFRYLGLHLAEDLTWGVNTKEIDFFSCEP